MSNCILNVLFFDLTNIRFAASMKKKKLHPVSSLNRIVLLKTVFQAATGSGVKRPKILPAQRKKSYYACWELLTV